MAVKIYYQKDAPIDALKGKKVAVIGYGSQGHAHSQNLRDSGIEVAVAELEGTDNFKLAQQHGFIPADIKTAMAGAALIKPLFLVFESHWHILFGQIGEAFVHHGFHFHYVLLMFRYLK